jgi:hypothetical protein
MTADGLGYQLSLKNYAEGSYTFRAVATVGGKTLVDKGYFSISGTEKEMNNLTADFKLLQNMSSESGGEFYSLSALNDLIAELKSKDAQSVIVEREVSRNLVDFKWIFWLLFGMLGLEWFVRKWVGIY